MNSFSLFTDVSLNPKLRVGMGAYLVVPTSLLEISPDSVDKSKATELLMMRRFKCTSSTRIEVQTVLWALEDYQKDLKSMAIVTWVAFFFLIGASAGFFYFGWKIAPWIIGGFAFFQNLPLKLFKALLISFWFCLLLKRSVNHKLPSKSKRM